MANNINLKDAFNKAKEISKKVGETTAKMVDESKPYVSKAAKSTVSKAKEIGKKVGETTVKVVDESKPYVDKAAKKTVEVAKVAKDKSLEIAIKGKDELIKALDQNGNGEIDIDDIIILGLKTPGVKIDRASFLRKELFKLYPESIINDAIATNPAKAGIKKEDIDTIADNVIKAERNTVSGVSAALGAPGGAAMLATIPADIAQYYGVLLRTMQKLLYLYGFPQIDLGTDGQVLDSATLNTLTICLGVMYGCAGANNALKAMAKALATGVEKKLINSALTKGTIYPIVKSIASWFGKKMTKEVFAGFFKGAIPVIGGVIGGSVTFFSFKPCCDLLKKSLQETKLANPDYIETNEDNIVDVEVVSKEIDSE